MRELLLLCTSHVYFPFNGEIDIQVDGVVLGSLLGLL